MPATSKAQQRFMGMVHALQKGELSPSDVSDEVKDAADQMDDSDAEDYASTKHTGKPEHVPKEVVRKLREMIRQIVKENPTFLLKKEAAKRDYKAEYKKFQSSDKAKKYRAELNQYNRKKGTYGNGDGKDASHKGGKIVGFESQSKNRGRAEKSRLKKESFVKSCTVKEISTWLKTLEEFRYRKVRGVDARRVASFVNKGMNEEDLPVSLQKKWEHRKYGREKQLATKYVEMVLNKSDLKETVNERKLSSHQKKAILIAIQMSGNMTGAVKKIERIKKGLSNDKKVKDALRLANESINEGGMGVLSTDQADILQGIVLRNKTKNLKAILKVALKSGYFKNVDKKELLGYIDGAKQFVRYMKNHPMESISINESAVTFWQDMFRPGPIPKKYITQLIKKRGELPSKKHIKAIYRSNGNPSSSELAKSWKLLTKEKYVRAASGMWRWNADFTGWESVNEGPGRELPPQKYVVYTGFGRKRKIVKHGLSEKDALKLHNRIEKSGKYDDYGMDNHRDWNAKNSKKIKESVNEVDRRAKSQIFREWNKFEKEYGNFFKAVVKLGKVNTKVTGDKTDEKIFLTNFTRNVGKFYALMQSWVRGQNESVNEANFDRGTSGLPKGFTDDYYKIVKKLSKGKGYLTLSKSDKKKVWNTLGKIYTESVNEECCGNCKEGKVCCNVNEKISKDEWSEYPKYARKLKPYMKRLLKVPVKVRVIKQANHNPWIEVRVARFGKDVIPNDFRLKAAKVIGATSIKDKSNVNYGNIRSNSVSMKHDQWVKLLGRKV